ncbi:MAG: ParA family protein [Methylophilus sp.]|nr:ParA family protein [Methylophilus sp.]
MTRIAIFNQKGGVGKTTTALNLAAAMSRRQLVPLMIDMDPQAHLTQIHNASQDIGNHHLFSFYKESLPLSQLILPWEGLGKIIPSHKELIKVDSVFGKGPSILNRLRYGLDALDSHSPNLNSIMDCCPYLGVLSLNAIFAADLIIIPIASDFLSLKGAKKVDQTLRALEPVLKRRVPRRYLITRYDRRRSMTFSVEKEAFECFGEDLCKTVISENVTIAESPQYHQDIFSFSMNSTGAQDYRALLDELLKDGLIQQN